MTHESLQITGCTLIDGTGSPASTVPMTIRIEDGRFSSVTPTLPEDWSTTSAAVVDARGKYVIPGLINSNVHLLDGIMMMGVGGVEYLARFEGRYHEVIEEAAQIALRAGMTTVFDTWNALEPIKYSRDRIASGTVPGARIFCAGNIVGMGGPFSGDFCLECRPTTSAAFADRSDALFEAGVGRRLSALPPEEVRAIVRDYLGKGIDFLKFAVSDHIVVGPTYHQLKAIGPYFTFSDRVSRVIVEETKRAGLPVVTHTTSIESFQLAIDLEVDAMMHCSIVGQIPMSQESIAQMKAKSVWGEIQPTTRLHQEFLDKVGGRWAKSTGGVNRENIVKLIENHAPILMGTDAGCTDPDVLHSISDEEQSERPFTLGKDHLMWFKAMSEMGMEPMAMLLAATSNVAKAYHKSSSLGTVEVGKLADALVLNSNPLADFNAYGDIDLIVKDGAPVDRRSLPAQNVVYQPRTWHGGGDPMPAT
jgi:imidazolonepropionase-like amidohydrolase